MRCSVFEKILDDLVASDSYFSKKKQGSLGFTGIFATPKTYLGVLHVSLLWNIGLSVGRYKKDVRVNNTQEVLQHV